MAQNEATIVAKVRVIVFAEKRRLSDLNILSKGCQDRIKQDRATDWAGFEEGSLRPACESRTSRCKD